MKTIAVLHHTALNLPSRFDYVQSYAGYTHMLNFQSEIPNADFISFIYLKKFQLFFKTNNCAPWFYSKWLSIIFRIPFFIFICIKYNKIIIYHSKGFYFYFPFILIFRHKIIMQVNEIYSNVSGNQFSIFFEKIYISSLKKIIVSNINLKQKWFCHKEVLLRGGYFRLPLINNSENYKSNNYIYSGSIDDFKMGNLKLLINLIKSIPPHITLYLCLLITDEDYMKVKNSLCHNSSIYLYRDVADNDLKKLYSKCKYGLVLQDPNKPFNLTSFPSKVFSYINNGLVPIAQKNQSFLDSEIKDIFGFIESWEWNEILAISSGPTMSVNIAEQLNKDLLMFINQ